MALKPVTEKGILRHTCACMWMDMQARTHTQTHKLSSYSLHIDPINIALQCTSPYQWHSLCFSIIIDVIFFSTLFTQVFSHPVGLPAKLDLLLMCLGSSSSGFPSGLESSVNLNLPHLCPLLLPHFPLCPLVVSKGHSS